MKRAFYWMAFGIYNQNLFGVLYYNPIEDIMIDSNKVKLGQNISDQSKSIIDIIIFNFGDFSASFLNGLICSGCSPIAEIMSDPEKLKENLINDKIIPRELTRLWYEKEILMGI